MAFCSNCGSELKEGEKFCTNCGKAVSTEERTQKPINYTENNTVKKPKKKKKVWKIILIIFLLLVISAGAYIYHEMNEDFPKDIGKEKTTDIEIGGIVFPMSEAYEFADSNASGGQSYKTKGGRSYMLFESTDLDIPEGFDIADKDLEAKIYEAIKSNADAILTSPKEVSTDDMNIDSLKCWSKAYEGTYEGINAHMKYVATYNSYSKKFVAVTIVTASSYADKAMARYDRMLNTAKVNKSVSSSAEGVSVDLKDLLDSYEEFMDEYIEFMKKYKSNSTDVASMLGDYTEIMQKYTDFATKISNLNTSNMSPADYAYYMEVTTRIYKKLAEIE
ncbi:zinc-ribbon domain-containing protein [Butyrivibrio sp. ob235]|uniref:zinc ribbon domain-containing protein n=1 Tax=Butyrivibrio sp. ob235 TaxID=1761780 RepID=UPI0008C5533D|nr:zinc ribbon domain-containing protein [Butyrivibrio sp. ob235]SEM18638.1 zinc-ribbon domain-containing protein [Butyrivibrio sp. ob235]